MTLSSRAEVLLKALVERYIAEGQPVGSRTLAKQAGLELSPATIRNVMADLEELGLISSPHTSAGRIPTARGYRLFVDSLLRVQKLGAADLRKIEHQLPPGNDPQQLIEAASSLLSQITRFAGVVRIPRREQVPFRRLEFLSLSPSRVLVILITQDGRVHNRVIQPDKAYSPAELVQASNYFNDTYAGKPLTEVKQVLLRELQSDSEAMQRIMRAASEMARKAIANEQDQETELVVAGEANLFDIPELRDVQKLRQLFEAFATKQDLLHLLDQSMRADGVRLFIGAESGYQALEDCSVVTSSYRVDGEIVGTLGVIGPTRMPYEHVIPIVDVTARLLSGALSAERAEERISESGKAETPEAS